MFCIVANGAGIEENDIGIEFIVGGTEAMFTHDGGYNFAIAKVHGTAVTFNIKGSCSGCGGWNNDFGHNRSTKIRAFLFLCSE